MSSLFFHKTVEPPAEKKIIVEERKQRTIEYEAKTIKTEIKRFKELGLSFIIDNFYRSDGKIVERTVSTDLETYTDKINGEYETFNVNDLEYFDKLKIKFLFPVQARRIYDNVEPIDVGEIDNWKNPTTVPVTEDELRAEYNNYWEIIEHRIEKSKIIHLMDIDENSKAKFYESISYLAATYKEYLYFCSSEQKEELFDRLAEKLTTINNSNKDKMEEDVNNDVNNELYELMKNFE